MAQVATLHEPKVRKPGFNWDAEKEQFPHYYAGDNAFYSHFMTGFLTLVAGIEEAGVKSIKEVLKSIEDPELRKRAILHIGQESVHAKEHYKFLEIIEELGYDTGPLLKVYDLVMDKFLFDVVFQSKPYGEKLAMSFFSAVEHVAHAFCLFYYKHQEDFASSPQLQNLLAWHAAEEIEHRDGVFDISAYFDDSYITRAAGMALVLSSFFQAVLLAAGSYIVQDKQLTTKRLLTDTIIFFSRENILTFSLKEILRYFKPGFHPSDYNSDPYVLELLRSSGQLHSEGFETPR